MINKIYAALIILITVIFAVVVLANETDQRLEEAKEFFQKYIQLRNEYDPAVADLYSDDAVATEKFVFQGKKMTKTRPAIHHKALVRGSVAEEKSNNMKFYYNNISYALDGESVWIKADQVVEFYSFKIPCRVLFRIKQSSSGSWLIYEKITETD